MIEINIKEVEATDTNLEAMTTIIKVERVIREVIIKEETIREEIIMTEAMVEDTAQMIQDRNIITMIEEETITTKIDKEVVILGSTITINISQGNLTNSLEMRRAIFSKWLISLIFITRRQPYSHSDSTGGGSHSGRPPLHSNYQSNPERNAGDNGGF